MKRLFALRCARIAATLSAAALFVVAGAQAQPSTVLIDLESDQTILSEEASLKVESPAVVPMMTLYTALTLLEENKIPLEAPLAAATSEAPASKHGSAKKTAGRKTSKAQAAPRENSAADALLAFAVSADRAAGKALIKLAGETDKTFTARMNELAKALELQNTHFTSPFADAADGSTTSALDAANLAKALFNKFPQAKLWTAERTASFDERTIDNTNPFLNSSVSGVSVVETSQSANAVVLAEDQKANGRIRSLLVVVLDADDRKNLRERVSTTLLRGWRDYEAVMVYPAGAIVANVPIYRGESDDIPVKVNDDVFVTIPRERLLELGEGAIELSIRRWSPLIAPIRAGEQLGTLSVSSNGEVLKTVPITTEKSVGEGNFLKRLTDNIRLAFDHDARRQGAVRHAAEHLDDKREAANTTP